jgi:hypothetical protein
MQPVTNHMNALHYDELTAAQAAQDGVEDEATRDDDAIDDALLEEYFPLSILRLYSSLFEPCV